MSSWHFSGIPIENRDTARFLQPDLVHGDNTGSNPVGDATSAHDARSTLTRGTPTPSCAPERIAIIHRTA
jgi:hypothetical protein